MTSWQKRYPKGGKRCRCRVPGCSVRRDTPQEIRAHRVRAHKNLTAKAKPKARANTKKRKAGALPSKPGMRKVRARKATEESPYRRMVKVIARDVMQEIVANMEER